MKLSKIRAACVHFLSTQSDSKHLSLNNKDITKIEQTLQMDAVTFKELNLLFAS